MRKLTSLLVMLVLSTVLAFGQTKNVTGRITDDQGNPVPFASVKVQGTKTGVSADADGRFTIKANEGQTLLISATDMKETTLKVGSLNNYAVSLERSSATQIKDVVVTTALGIKRRPKEVGYANTTVKSDALTVGKSPTLAQALSGKVAGLTVSNVNSSVNNDTRIVLRGNRSLSGDNTALIVLDGVPVPSNTINYLNPNDIEEVTVLKGGQAATLFGSDGVNGALMITTKKGSRTKPQITFSHTSEWNQVSYLPKFQNEFGSGSDYGGLVPSENFRPFENQSYGAPFDGQPRSIGRVLEDGSDLTVPYAPYPGQKRKVWDIGYSMQNNISLSGGDQNSTYFMSAQDVDVKGVVPGDKYHRTSVRFNSSRTFGNFKASFDATYTVDRTQRSTTDFYFYVLNAPAHIPLPELRDWRNNKFANPNGYYNDYYNNPWFMLDNNRLDRRNNYFNGNVSLDWKPFSFLNVLYRLGVATTNTFQKSWTGQFKYSDWAKHDAYTKDPQYNDYDGIFRAATDINGAVGDAASWGNRINQDVIVTYNKDFGDYSLKAIGGMNLQQRQGKSLNIGSTAVVVPDVYNVANRTGELTGGESNTLQRKFSYYGDATVGYKDYVFLHGSVRNDNTSLFYKSNRDRKRWSYTYYGADLSAVLTDIAPSIKSNILSYAKVRVGWNKNGNDNIGLYALDPTFSAGGGFPYGTLLGYGVDGTLPAGDIGPEFTETTEAGAELAFFKNKLNVDFSIYKQKIYGQVLSAQVSSATGYTNTLINAAKLDNKGIEVEVRGSVISKKNFSVDVNANYTYNTNEVKELFGGAQSFLVTSNGSNAFIYAEVGKMFPYMKVTHWQRDAATGKVIVSPTDGWPLIDGGGANMGVGTTIPKHILGVGVRVRYKAFTFAANAEYRGGHYVYHDIGEDMAFTGTGKVTDLYHRAPFIWPNSVVDDGTGKFVPNTNIAVAQGIAIYKGWGDYGFSRGILFSGEVFTTSAAFWKLRDATISWEVPQKWVSKTKVIKGATVSVSGRNLFMLLPKDNWYTDPEFSTTTGNGQGINNTLNTPPARTYGATISVTF